MRNVAYAALALAIVGLVIRVVLPESRPEPDAEFDITDISTDLRPAVRMLNRPDDPMTLQQRMDLHGVPGVSIAVMKAGEIVFTHTAGVRDLGDATPIDADTVFQAGSISKPVFATLLLRYRDKRGLDLDADINTLLTSWQLPLHPWSGKSEVTLRRLLSHTAGTTVHGFAGQSAGDAIPTLTEILSGSPPANTAPVIVDMEPGTGFRYSGGGFVLAQLALEDSSGRDLEGMASTDLFEPLNMKRSSFSQPLDTPLGNNAANGYGPRGGAVEGGARSYGALAAGGLWTTPSDILQWAASLWRASRGQADEIVSAETAGEMLTGGLGPVGLGVFVGEAGATRYFRHSGSNAGFESKFIVFEQSGDGIAIMTNGNTGYVLIEEVILRAAEVLGWKDITPTTKVVLEVEPSELQRFVGSFRTSSPFPARLEVSLDGHSLILDAPDAGFLVADKRFYPESESSFFSTDGQELLFESDGEGNVYSLSYNGFLRAVKET